jgi:predicted branched-subunit amino acid permease
MHSNTHDPQRPYWSWAGFREGAWLTIPFLPGTAVFGTALGTIAAQKGLTVFDTALISAIVYSGVAQMVALEIWPDRYTLTALAAVAFVTLTVNSRFLLMSASMRPWFGSLPAWQAYPTLYFTTDTTWLIGIRYRAGGGSDVGVYVGSGVILWATWVAATTFGHLAGALVSEPRRFGLDLILPIFFAAFLVPLWRGRRRAVGWVIGGVAALACAWLVPGWWFIVVGALAGSIAGGLLDE